MNPLCACGCGLEVRYPWASWVLGHSARTRLRFDKVSEIEQCISDGMPRKKIADGFDVGTVTIERISWGMTDARWAYVRSPTGLAIPPTGDRHIIRMEDITKSQLNEEERKCLRIAKRKLKEVRLYLSKLPQKAS